MYVEHYPKFGYFNGLSHRGATLRLMQTLVKFAFSPKQH